MILDTTGELCGLVRSADAVFVGKKSDCTRRAKSSRSYRCWEAIILGSHMENFANVGAFVGCATQRDRGQISA